MRIRAKLFTTFIPVLSLILPAYAQDSRAPGDGKVTSIVTAYASSDRVRFTGASSIVQIRLEVYSSAGTKIVDNEIRGGNVLDWRLQDGQAERIANDTYLCVITVKGLAGKLTQRIGVLTFENGTPIVKTIDASQLTSKQAEAIGPVEEDASFTVLKNDELQTTTVIAHNGEDGQLTRVKGALSFRIGDFFRGTDTEQMRLTAQGNLGIGITNPQAKLEVDGFIRTTQGVVFPDGSVQFSAALKTYGPASLGPGQSWLKLTQQGQEHAMSPTIGGTGTTGRISKWLDGPNGILNDSNITEASGAIGVNGTPDTRFRLDVNGSTRIRGSNPGFNLEGLRAAGNIWVFQTVDDDGRFRLFAQDNVNPGVERLTINLSNGFVGLGATVPAGSLHVRGANPVRIIGDTLTLSGTESVDFMARTTIFNSDLGGMRIQRQGSGNIDTIFFAAASGSSMSEVMRVRGDGRVAIGTAAPNSKLYVEAAEERAIFGHNTATNSIGVFGQSLGAESVGVLGRYDGPASNAGWGVFGFSQNGYAGVFGSGNKNGVFGLTASSADSGVFGKNDGAGPGVGGFGTAGDGVFGTGNRNGVHGRTGATNDSGVWGENTGSGYGVAGSTVNGFAGVIGTGSQNGVYGQTASADGAKSGVFGRNDGNGHGVAGFSVNNDGVFGESASVNGFGGFFKNSGGGLALRAEGTASVKILQVTGGFDLAEQFIVTGDTKPGMVVAIDPERPGQLSIARGAYSRRVAGVISGANQLDAGLVLTGPIGARDLRPVALTGRVWVLCDASKQPIKAGDLLTTSYTPGHAMKVINHAKARGAVIGKAMTGLVAGTGLVLVLVSLQ